MVWLEEEEEAKKMIENWRTKQHVFLPEEYGA